MMMNKRRLYRRLSQINSVAQLQRERDRLDALAEVKELELKYDYLTIKESLTVTNILDLVLGRFSTIGPIVENVMEGFGFVFSLFGGRKRKKNKSCIL